MRDIAIFAELSDWTEYSKILITMFAMVPPPLIVPMFAELMGDRPVGDKIGAALVGAFGFAVMTIAFTFLGQDLLRLFGITLGAFKVAGGLVILSMGLELTRTGYSSAYQPVKDAGTGWFTLGVVPLATPILAGPSCVTGIIIFAGYHQTLGHKVLMVAVLLAITVYIAVVLSAAAATRVTFAPAFTSVFNRVRGVLLMAVAAEFIFHGIAMHFPTLATSHSQ
jgi:MarC family membrane protein